MLCINVGKAERGKENSNIKKYAERKCKEKRLVFKKCLDVSEVFSTSLMQILHVRMENPVILNDKILIVPELKCFDLKFLHFLRKGS